MIKVHACALFTLMYTIQYFSGDNANDSKSREKNQKYTNSSNKEYVSTLSP